MSTDATVPTVPDTSVSSVLIHDYISGHRNPEPNHTIVLQNDLRVGDVYMTHYNGDCYEGRHFRRITKINTKSMVVIDCYIDGAEITGPAMKPHKVTYGRVRADLCAYPVLIRGTA